MYLTNQRPNFSCYITTSSLVNFSLSLHSPLSGSHVLLKLFSTVNVTGCICLNSILWPHLSCRNVAPLIYKSR